MRKTGANSGLVSAGVTCLHRSIVRLINLSVENSPLLQTSKGYASSLDDNK